jgi:hypothetical protein
LAADGAGKLHVVWHDYRYEHAGQYEIFHKMLDGGTWGPDERLTRSDGHSRRASVEAGDSGLVFVIWADNRDGNSEIYYKRFKGTTWEADVRLTDASGESLFPSTALDGEGRLHVVWWDDRDGNTEIYYKLRDPGVVSGMDRPGPTGHNGLRLTVLPNPVRGHAGFRLSRVAGKSVSIAVYDISGRLVWRHTGEPGGGETYGVDWPGTDRAGRRVAPGVYFVRAGGGSLKATAKVIMLK